MAILGRFYSDGMLDVFGNDALWRANLEGRGVLDVVVVVAVDETLVPPLYLRRLFHHEVLLHVDVVVDAGLARLLGNALPHGIEGCLSSERVRLCYVLALLVEYELS